MAHLGLLQDLGWLMVSAALAAIIFQRLRQPVILGYILAGILLGPGSFFPSPLQELGNINALAELGVLFLMFYIGLEFNPERLRSVFAPALLALILQTALMMFVAMQAGQWLGWGPVQSLFFGGILSISSSMVTIKLIREKGQLNRPYAELTVGILIFEDILAIIVLVVLTGVAVSGTFEWNAVGKVTFLVGIFVVAVYVVGKLLAPRVLGMLHRFGTDETIVLFTIGLILGVSLLAAQMEFSLALGGFVAGAILSKTSLAHEIETLTEPLRNFFSALFFVSVGTFVDLRELAVYWLPIVLLTLLMMGGKFISCWLGMVLAGQKPEVSTRASLAKVQIGEFGFVIATLGLSYGVVDEGLKATAYGVAILSISLTPAVNLLQSKINAYAEERVPGGLKRGIGVYLNWIETVRLAAGQSGALKVAVRPFSRIIISFLLVNAVVILASVLIGYIPLPDRMANYEVLIQRGAWGVAALLCLPFLVDIVRNLNVLVTLISEIALSRRPGGAVGRFMRELIQGVFFTLVLLVFSLVFLAACGRYFPTAAALFGFILVCLALAILFWRRVVKVHSRFEYALIQGMEGAVRQLVKPSMEESIRRVSAANPWPVRIHEMSIKKQTWACGRRVHELGLRDETGATIVAIERGGRVYYDVGPDMPLSPEDRVHLLGEAGQIEAAEAFMNRPLPESEVREPRFRHFDKILVGPTADLVGTSLLEADLRSQSGVTVVGIQRGDHKIIGPTGGEVIHAGDLLLVLGRPEDVEALKKSIFDS
ncbi:MAG: hypothetical protein DRP71_07935 [Verrucomicrobia bacterium]|nr:MAG: hypothetical protein DRP71_07935 [Verrucomicrobiota bacterium]